MDEKPTQNEITAAGNISRLNDEDDSDVTDVEVKNINNSTITSTASAIPFQPSAAPQASALSAAAQSAPNAPVGDVYQRLGYWRCRLCTSQKYLNTPPPKQPSEPGHWPLRDVSKMVTHFTRMHGEHNNVERCMELGTALGENRGPFHHWLVVTKKEKALDAPAIAAAVEELENGQMPELLRKVSTSAANFPRD